MLKTIYVMAVGVLLVGCDSKPKDAAYYLKNEKERQEMLSRCEVVPFDFSNRERPAPEDCNNAELAQKQLDIYKMTGQQDSKEYFFNNPNIREKVLGDCQKIPSGYTTFAPCTNAYATEKEVRINILKRKTAGIEKVEDFLNNKEVIRAFLSECRRSEYVRQETICTNLLEADRQWMLIALEETAKGRNEVEYFLNNPHIMRQVNYYCSTNGQEYPFLLDQQACKNALIAEKNF